MLSLKSVTSMPDRQACLDVYRQSLDYYQAANLPFPDRSTVQSDRTTAPDGILPSRMQYQLIMLDNKPVGVVKVVRDYPVPHAVTLSLLLIKQHYRRQGIGSAIVHQLASHYSENGYAELQATVLAPTEARLAFWRSQGFDILDARRLMLASGDIRSQVLLVRPLSDLVTV
ncbi:GNAT family N-acetyltransferase [Lacticaseibacillus mingshuiensis]|uniref:GNAT family N-acetyltransferase n=1 Tax=Lacticaseibacillus mingshuiensis TaxID=2799574 RepID=A0ABW4CLT6_9LACO|nr:GNAT family N-acetyltransferase [Lacticaseibacillus mingshuiensis]